MVQILTASEAKKSILKNTFVIDSTEELELKNGGYVLDGEVKQFESANKTIKIKQQDGSLVEQEIPLLKTFMVQ